MKNLIPLPISSIVGFDSIVLCKDEPMRTRLQSLSPSISKLYDYYDSLTSPFNLKTIAPATFNAIEKSDLLHCYNGSTVGLRELIDSIKDRQEPHLFNTCQMCTIDSDSTVDHFLPKEQFPEYAVMASNLIPACSQCNGHKGTAILDKNKNYIVLNLYYNPLPNVRYLNVKVNFTTRVPSCKFELINNNIDPDIFKLIDSHYKRMHLLSRFRNKFNHIYIPLERQLKKNSIYNGNPEKVKELLLADAAELADLFGINYWRAVLIEALANSNSFLSRFTI